MKKKIGLTLSALALSAVMCLGVACGGNPPPADETYTITFKNGDTVIKTETKKKGEKVTVPGAPTNEDTRYTFTGWEGVNPGQTEVTVLADRTINAVWYEMFGSNKTFGITQRNLEKDDIEVDGDGIDETWADATALKLDENGSTLKLLWDSSALYLFADIVKAEEEEVETQAEEAASDALIVTLDLLHNETLAADNWDGTSWGGVYRGNNPDIMVEGGYTISLGEDENGDPVTNVAPSGEWLSLGGYTGSEAEFVTTDKGYAVEFKIALTDGRIGEYTPALNQQIGLAVRTADGASAIETFKGYGDHGPKSLSNMQLLPNENNAEFLWKANEVREHYDIKVDGKEDEYGYGNQADGKWQNLYSLYSEAGVNEELGYTVKALWKDGGKLYLFATFEQGEAAEPVQTLKISAFGGSVTLTPDDPEGEIAAEGIEKNAHSFLTVKVNDETVIDEGECLITLNENTKNIGRKMVEAKRLPENLAEEDEIKVDGIKENAYGDAVTDVLPEYGFGNAKATAEVYMRWDDEYLYVFVDVTDATISVNPVNPDDINADQFSDSVELWLDTCQSFQVPDQSNWGNGNHRPLGLYRGEGLLRVTAPYGDDDEYRRSGREWLWDDPNTRGTVSSVKTDKGYAVEYAIPWADKGSWTDSDGFGNYIPSTGVNTWDYTNNKLGEPSAKLGEIINFAVNLNDNNGDGTGDFGRVGMSGTSKSSCESWQNAFYLSHLKLVAAD